MDGEQFPYAALHSPDPPRSYPFAIRHPFPIHGLLVVLCWLTYLKDPEDVVWRFVKVSSSPRILEHLAFGVAAVFLGVAVILGAWPSGNTTYCERRDTRSIRRRCIGEILHGIGISSLLPISGCILLVCGEVIRSTHYALLKIRLTAHLKNSSGSMRIHTQPPVNLETGDQTTSSLAFAWSRIIVIHVAEICAFLSMLAFSISLRDRLADVLFSGTALIFVISRFIASTEPSGP
jgi:hypothetical protein